MRHLLLVCLFVFATFAPAVVAAQATASAPAMLLLPGAAPPDSLDANAWFGLYRTPHDGYQLRRANIRLERSPAACGSDTKISAAQPNEPLLLVTGIPALHEISVDTAFRGSRFLRPGETLTLTLGKTTYRLTAAGRPAAGRYNIPMILGYELRLAGAVANDSVSQVVEHLDTDLENTPALLWAGDLDGDAKLDLLLQLPGAGYSKDFALYLSSLARTPDRVKWAAPLLCHRLLIGVAAA